MVGLALIAMVLHNAAPVLAQDKKPNIVVFLATTSACGISGPITAA
jgi:hypothetical protein